MKAIVIIESDHASSVRYKNCEYQTHRRKEPKYNKLLDFFHKEEKRFADVINDIQLKMERRKPAYNLYSLNQFIDELHGSHRENENYLLFFSIRAILSMESKRMILNNQKALVRERLEHLNTNNTEDFGRFVLFDLDPSAVLLPETYWVNIGNNSVISKYDNVSGKRTSIKTPTEILNNLIRNNLQYACKTINAKKKRN